MGWSFWMEKLDPQPCPSCGHVDEIEWDYDDSITFNLAPMFSEALGGVTVMRDFDGMTGTQAAPLLERGVKRMEDDPAKYEAMNPPNGWGDYEGALEQLRTLLRWCREQPDAILRVE